jgi:WD40 repeat protein
VSSVRGVSTTSVAGKGKAALTVEYSPNGAYLAAGGGCIGELGEIEIWNGVSLERHRGLHAQAPTVTALAFSLDSALLAAACQSADRVRLWTTEAFEQYIDLPLLPDRPRRNLAGLIERTTHVGAMTFSPSGMYLAAGCWDLRAKVWNLQNGRLKEIEVPVRHNVDFVRFSGDESILLTATYNAVFLWDLGAGSLMNRFLITDDDVWSHVDTGRDDVLVSVSRKRRIRVCRLRDGSCDEYQLPTDRKELTALAYGERLDMIAIGFDDGQIMLWSLPERVVAHKWRIGPDPVMSLSFSPVKDALCTVSAASKDRIIECALTLS